MQITKVGDNYKIEFRYNPLLIQKVKEIPGRKFDYVNKTWLVPVKNEAAVMRFARAYNFHIGEIPQEPEQNLTPDELPFLSEQPQLKGNLFPFQERGVAYALDKKRLIIGDQPGLGKTVQAIATISHSNAFPCLVICPSSLKINWQREWEMWTKYKALILTDQVKNNFHLYYKTGMVNVFIVNYESLKKYFVEKIDKQPDERLTLKHIHFKKHVEMFRSVIIDEAHRTKSTKTQQAKFCKGIATKKEYIIALTGTPVINKPKDLISQLGIIERMLEFGGYKNFVNRFCAGPNEASNLRELNYLLRKHCFYRREKHEVLKDLPPKMRQVVICEIDAVHRKEYLEAENDLVKYLKVYKEATDQQIRRSMRGEVMVRIGILKNISARGKLSDVYDFIADILESGEKLVVFAHLKEVIQKVKAEFPKCLTITGDDNMADRQRSVDSFQNNPDAKLIICSTKAAGVGLTLTAASRVSFIELPWTYADCEQAEDRTHRIGQTDSVTAYYFLGKDTIDEKIYQIIQTKKSIASTITGTTEQVDEDIVSMIADLFNQDKKII